MGQPKQFLDLLGHPVLYYTLRAFEETPEVDRVYVVGDCQRVEGLVQEYGISKYAGCTPPGESRSLSTRNGLALLEEDPLTVVLVHDGARCLLTPDLIRRVVTTIRVSGADGVVPALPVSDTIKVAEDGAIVETLDRARLHAAQTPQAFRFGLFRDLHAGPEERLHAATDDASLVEAAGGRVLLVAGEKINIKLTTPEDLVFAEAILTARAGMSSGARS